MLKNKFIYYFYVVSYLLYALMLASCASSPKSKGKKEKFLADATRPKTDLQPIFINNKIDFDKFLETNANAQVNLKITHTEVQKVSKKNEGDNKISLSTDLPKIRLYVQLNDSIGNFLQNANTTKNRKIWCNFSDEMLERRLRIRLNPSCAYLRRN